MGRVAAAARRHWLDVLVVLLAVAAVAQIWAVGEGPGGTQLPTWTAAPLAALVVLMLLARRRWPFAAPAALWLFSAALSFADGELVAVTTAVFLAGMAAAFLLGNLRDDVQARLGLAITVGCSLLIVGHSSDRSSLQLIFIPIEFGLVWLAGLAMRERVVRAEAAEAQARVAVAEERARIARELHDVVAHAVSVMVLQVGAVRHRLGSDRPEDAEALHGVERAGRTALTEMRRLLAAMRQDGEEVDLAPQPGLARLEPMLDQVRRAGLPVALTVEGAPVELPAALDLSAFRIVQEGLTNALRHARAGRAEVLLRYGADDLLIEVRDDGRGGAVTGPAGSGHGLVGIRERVKLYGGEVTAGRGADGYVLRTRLPLEGRPG